MGGFDPADPRLPVVVHQRRFRRASSRFASPTTAAPSIGQGGGQDGPSDDFYVQETLTKVLGRHQVKFGGEFRYGVERRREPARRHELRRTSRSRRNFTSLRPNVGNLTVADGGNAFASYLLGYMASNTVTRSPIFDWRSAYGGAFVQDDWRLTSRFTLNLGMRWDYEAPITETAATRSMPGSTRTRSRSSARRVRPRGSRRT